jgi:hypothetical protein
VKLGARIAFAASLAANVAALYLLFEEPPSVHAPMALAAPAAQRVGVVQTGADVVAYRETLLARGLALEETKPLVLARLMAELERVGRVTAPTTTGARATPPQPRRTFGNEWRQRIAPARVCSSSTARRRAATRCSRRCLSHSTPGTHF